LLSAVGQTWLKLPILISSLLLNYPARSLTGYLVRFPLADESVTLATTKVVPESARMPKIPVFGGVSLTLVLVLILVGVMAVVYRRTVFGYETQMTGFNGSFARYGGVNVPQRTLAVMATAGAIGGAIGTHLIIGETLRFIDGELVSSGVAWTGLLVSLLAANGPFAILAAGAFFSALHIGGLAMQREAGLSWQLAQVLQAVVIVALVGRFSIGWRRRAREAPEPEDRRLPAEFEKAHVGEM
jgi:simple sugar transport system permease protein